MATSSKGAVRPFFLGVEGGGTRTLAILADAAGRLLRRVEVGSANVKLLTDLQLAELFESIAAAMPQPHCIAIGLAGARAEADLRRIRSAVAKLWPSVPCRVTNDLETALAAADSKTSGKVRVLVLSGTGSCCYGRNQRRKVAQTGGWGHVLGDGGSGFDIGLRALKTIVSLHDEQGRWSKLGRRILRRLRLSEPNELINWAQSAGKAQVAALAVEVFAAAAQGDKTAARILVEARDVLAQEAIACARKLAKRGAPVEFVFAGGILLKQPQFARQLGRRLKTLWPKAEISQLKREGAWGAVALAQQFWHEGSHRQPKHRARQVAPMESRIPSAPFPRDGELPLTEQRNPLSANLDRLPLPKAIGLMLSEDAKIPAAIIAELKPLEQAVRHVIRAFERSGRLFYIGAGTSGRLGVLDASECPPTFGTPPEMVQGIIAGGIIALTHAVEGAEDDAAAGAQAITSRKVDRRDVVVGISASGRAPFVWGALDAAARRGAVTILLTFNPFKGIHGHRRPKLVIAPRVGPEILAGSTRLKAGTATKLILNIFTTLAMARTGRVTGNLMARVNPTNAKLRERAVRIVGELCAADSTAARKALEECNWIVKDACARLDSARKA